MKRNLLLLAACLVGNLFAVEPQPPSELQTLRIVVLPFQNTIGAAAGEDWQQALPALVRSYLTLAEFPRNPGWKQIQPPLERAGWTAARAVDVKLARQIAQELNANVAVWGSFRHLTNGWAVEVKVLRADSEAAPVELQFTSPRGVDLAKSLALGLAKQLDCPIAADDRQWRMLMTDSEKADRCLAKAITLETQKPPAAEQEQAWREVLAADPRCGLAHASLCAILRNTDRTNDWEKAVHEFVRQQPQLCAAHLALARRLSRADDRKVAEREVRAAMQLHRGCPDATQGLFALFGKSERWADLLKFFEPAHTDRPHDPDITIFLAFARAQSGDLEGARNLLRSLNELPVESEFVDLALLGGALLTQELELVGRELTRLGPQAAESESIREVLASVLFSWKSDRSSNAPIARPRSFAPGELSAELGRRLTAEECKLVVNPLEITLEITTEARRLTVGLTNDAQRAIALFAEVTRRGRGAGDGGRRTANEALKDSGDPQTRLSCQEYAKLFVALARVLGLEAWLVHVERCADGTPGYHDCAALFLEGRGLLVDPTWRAFGIVHEAFTVLDDLQAISHQAMQLAAGQHSPARLRAGLKLNPEDRWTRLQFVRGMAKAGEPAVAAEELRKVRSSGAASWDVHEAAAELEMAGKRWKPALAELQLALPLSPSNALLHAQLGSVHLQLNELEKGKEHTEAALRLDRGEISAALRLSSQNLLAMVSAITQGKSGDRGSLDELKRRAEGGEGVAQFILANVCFEERPPRTEEGMRWLLKAAEQGDDHAQFNYAKNLLLLRGNDAGEEVVQWLTRSASQGNVEAQYRLGLFFYEGKLVKRDNLAAGQWILLAADKGNIEAKSLLKEMELFLSADELAEARKRATAFTPATSKAGAPKSKAQ